MKNLDCNESAKKKLSWCVKFTKEFLSVIILLEISYLLFFLSLFKIPGDKCGVSRLISGVDTIKIEDSVNTRPGKLYKVNWC